MSLHRFKANNGLVPQKGQGQYGNNCGSSRDEQCKHFYILISEPTGRR